MLDFLSMLVRGLVPWLKLAIVVGAIAGIWWLTATYGAIMLFFIAVIMINAVGLILQRIDDQKTPPIFSEDLDYDACEQQVSMPQPDANESWLMRIWTSALAAGFIAAVWPIYVSEMFAAQFARACETSEERASFWLTAICWTIQAILVSVIVATVIILV
jgi:hypothetical protein